ncbi:MBL fold metallo-hydrolase [Candidatus Uhrbacteria bacterium]|nr:MBL fold metallo-hydrolase [Candidatus Uhrbacteria bacterium]
MLQIKIYNVEHGNCAYLVTPNGESILVDAGHSSDADYYPRHEIELDLQNRGRSQVTIFINSNADHDHVSDLHDIHGTLQPVILMKNPTIDGSLIRSIKEQPLTNGLEAFCRMCDTYTNPIATPDLGGVEMQSFHNPFSQFEDTNNASLVTFFFYGKIGIIFPGDMEKVGWLELLKNPQFCAALQRTNIFVASHHGREGGYCAEVFNHCKPELVIISDKPVEHQTQEHSLYQQHASGVRFGEQVRKVVSTRSDGTIFINVETDKATYRLGVA